MKQARMIWQANETNSWNIFFRDQILVSWFESLVRHWPESLFIFMEILRQSSVYCVKRLINRLLSVKICDEVTFRVDQYGLDTLIGHHLTLTWILIKVMRLKASFKQIHDLREKSNCKHKFGNPKRFWSRIRFESRSVDITKSFLELASKWNYFTLNSLLISRCKVSMVLTCFDEIGFMILQFRSNQQVDQQWIGSKIFPSNNRVSKQ